MHHSALETCTRYAAFECCFQLQFAPLYLGHLDAVLLLIVAGADDNIALMVGRCRLTLSNPS